MKIEKHPILRVWVREDGAVLKSPNGCQFKKYRWTFGSNTNGYRMVCINGKHYLVHRIVAETFLGAPPEGKPEVDHIDRVRSNNHVKNLRWVSHKENETNKKSVEDSLIKYGVRECVDNAAYQRARYKVYREMHPIEIKPDPIIRRRERHKLRYARQKAKGLAMRKCNDGHYRWIPIV